MSGRRGLAMVLWNRNIFSLSLQSRFAIGKYKYTNILGEKVLSVFFESP